MTTIDLTQRITQRQFAALIGISRQELNGLVAAGHLSHDGDAGLWLQQYCARLRKAAQGRAAGSNLSEERARLAAVQRQRQELKLMTERGEFVPVGWVSKALAHTVARLTSSLETIPRTIALQHPEVPPDAVKVVRAVITRGCETARTDATAWMTLADDEADEAEDDEGVMQADPIE